MTPLNTCFDIVRDYLIANGYDGLAGEECGCGLDDLAPCCETMNECRPAYHWPRINCPRADEEVDDHCEWSGECGDGCYRTERRKVIP